MLVTALSLNPAGSQGLPGSHGDAGGANALPDLGRPTVQPWAMPADGERSASSDPFDDFDDDDFDDEFDDDFEEDWDDEVEDDGFGPEYQDTADEAFDVDGEDDEPEDDDVPLIVDPDADGDDDGDDFSDDADFDE
jgi:hypothetical protein